MKSGSSNKLRTENWQEHIHRRTNYPRTTFPWVFWKIIWDNEPILIPLLLLLLSRVSRVRLCATPRTAAHQASCPWDSPGKNTGVGCHFLLQSQVLQASPKETNPGCDWPRFRNRRNIPDLKLQLDSSSKLFLLLVLKGRLANLSLMIHTLW